MFACKLYFQVGREVDNCSPFSTREHLQHYIRDFAYKPSENGKLSVTQFVQNTQFNLIEQKNQGNQILTCSLEICIGFLNTVQITLSSNGGVVRDPSYLQKSRGAFPSFLGVNLAGSTFSESANETLSPLFGMSGNLSQIFLNSGCSEDPT